MDLIVDEFLDIPVDPSPRVLDLTSDPITQPILTVPLALQSTRKAVGAVGALDQRIRQLERRLEVLHAKRSRAGDAIHAEYTPVHVFEESASRSGPDGLAPGGGA